jgi:prepilin peptidase CpaA
MALSIFVFGIFPALLLAAAIYDLGTYLIPNVISGALVLLFLVYLGVAWVSGDPVGWRLVGLHFAAGAVALGLGMGLFALHWIGGGDAKIFASSCLWLGPVCAIEYTLTAAMFGGVLTVVLLLLRRFPVPRFLARPWILNLADPKAGVPYGVALALGAIAVLPGTDLLLAHVH